MATGVLSYVPGAPDGREEIGRAEWGVSRDDVDRSCGAVLRWVELGPEQWRSVVAAVEEVVEELVAGDVSEVERIARAWRARQPTPTLALVSLALLRAVGVCGGWCEAGHTPEARALALDGAQSCLLEALRACALLSKPKKQSRLVAASCALWRDMCRELLGMARIRALLRDAQLSKRAEIRSSGRELEACQAAPHEDGVGRSREATPSARGANEGSPENERPLGGDQRKGEMEGAPSGAQEIDESSAQERGRSLARSCAQSPPSVARKRHRRSVSREPSAKRAKKEEDGSPTRSAAPKAQGKPNKKKTFIAVSKRTKRKEKGGKKKKKKKASSTTASSSDSTSSSS